MAARIEDLNLPLSVVARIIKESLPDGVNVSREAKVAIARAAAVFVLYITNCSNRSALLHHRKTILPLDIFESLEAQSFEFLLSPLQEFLEEYKENKKNKKENTAKKKLNADKSAEDSGTSVEENDTSKTADAETE